MSTMSDPDKKKDFWDKIASITPLILGIAVTGVGVFFTHIYNFRQLQLNQITALEKLRPLLISDKAEDREFGYASFAALGYEDIAIRIVQIKKDESGRALLVELGKFGTPEIKANAAEALSVLDATKKLVNISEFGSADPDQNLLNKHPELNAPFLQGEKWAQETARKLGISSKLAIGILYDTAVHVGSSRASRFEAATSKEFPPPLNSREKEVVWLNAFLDERDRAMQQGPAARFYPEIKKRIDRLRQLVKDGDWELQSIELPNNSVEADAPKAARRSP